MSDRIPTDYEISKELRDEADASLAFMRQAYGSLGTRDFFQQAVLRGLSVVIKLLLHINSRT